MHDEMAGRTGETDSQPEVGPEPDTEEPIVEALIQFYLELLNACMMVTQHYQASHIWLPRVTKQGTCLPDYSSNLGYWSLPNLPFLFFLEYILESRGYLPDLMDNSAKTDMDEVKQEKLKEKMQGKKGKEGSTSRVLESEDKRPGAKMKTLSKKGMGKATTPEPPESEDDPADNENEVESDTDIEIVSDIMTLPTSHCGPVIWIPPIASSSVTHLEDLPPPPPCHAASPREHIDLTTLEPWWLFGIQL
ncbi:hypothetical protein C8J57DRAFT_1211392 [Mycena rebaudengoi]|nr:hypothetical protein C8J57DRAFT_1211392 [Mycena rebaudengoi]